MDLFKTWTPFILLAVSGFIAWGSTQHAVADYGRRLDRMEEMRDIIVDMRANVKWLVEVEARRQTRRDGQGHP